MQYVALILTEMGVWQRDAKDAVRPMLSVSHLMMSKLGRKLSWVIRWLKNAQNASTFLDDGTENQIEVQIIRVIWGCEGKETGRKIWRNMKKTLSRCGRKAIITLILSFSFIDSDIIANFVTKGLPVHVLWPLEKASGICSSKRPSEP